MKEFFSKFFSSEAAFIRGIRGMLLGLGTAEATSPSTVEEWIGVFLVGLAGLFAAGDQNPK